MINLFREIETTVKESLHLAQDKLGNIEYKGYTATLFTQDMYPYNTIISVLEANNMTVNKELVSTDIKGLVCTKKYECTEDGEIASKGCSKPIEYHGVLLLEETYAKLEQDDSMYKAIYHLNGIGVEVLCWVKGDSLENLSYRLLASEDAGIDMGELYENNVLDEFNEALVNIYNDIMKRADVEKTLLEPVHLQVSITPPLN